MKKRGFIQLGVFLFLAAGSALYAQNTLQLDDAVQRCAGEIEAKLTKGDKIVVLNFRSPSQRFSNYILDELMTALVMGGKVTVVDRANLELIQQEMNFQMSGEVSDSSAQAIGQKLGAQSIVSGNIEDMGAFYRVRLRTIEVVSAAIQVLSSVNVQKDAQVATLMAGSNSASAKPGAANSSATSYPHGLHYSTGEKVGKGFLNLIFGVGSFTMGDVLGGVIGVVLPVTGIALGVISVIPTADAEKSVPELGNLWMQAPAAILLVAHSIFSFVRPFAYDKSYSKKNGTYYAAEESNPLYHISFNPIHTPKKTGMSVLYGMSY
jgi:TolB-like protein